MAKIEDIREIGKGTGKERRMAIVRLKDRKGKIEVMKKKVILRDEMVRIEDDWMRKERMMQWRLEELARRKRRNNRRVWVRIWMEETWWSWEEEKKS